MFPCMGMGVFAVQEQSFKCYDCKMFLHILARLVGVELVPGRGGVSSWQCTVDCFCSHISDTILNIIILLNFCHE